MPWARWNFPPATATIAGLHDRHAGRLRPQRRRARDRPGRRARRPTSWSPIYNKANTLGMTISLKVASALPVGDVRQHRPVRAPHAAGVEDGGQRRRDVQRRRHRHGDRHDRRRRGLPLHREPVPDDRHVDLDRSSVIDLTSTLTGTNTSGYQGGSTAGHAELDRAGAGRRQWVVITFRAIPFGTDARDAEPRRARRS